MNRESKRTMQRQGQLKEMDEAVAAEEPASTVAARPTTNGAARSRRSAQRTTPMRFLREVRDELRQVAWPSRAEMVNYSTVVLITLVIMVLLIFALNFVFGKAVFFMFQK